MANRVRNKRISFYLDDEEYEAVKYKMKQMKIKNLSLYMRKMALEGSIIQVDYSVFSDIAKSVSSVSNSINQIAKRLNTLENIYAEDMRQIQKAQEKMWELIKSIDHRLP